MIFKKYLPILIGSPLLALTMVSCSTQSETTNQNNKRKYSNNQIAKSRISNDNRFNFPKTFDNRTIVNEARLNTQKGVKMVREIESSNTFDTLKSAYRVIYGEAKEFYIFVGTKKINNKDEEVILTEDYGFKTHPQGFWFVRYLNGAKFDRWIDSTKQSDTPLWTDTQIVIDAMMANDEFFEMW